MLPVAEYMATLPRKRMAASAIIRNAAGEILLVKPTYRPDWLMPGGTIEADESPRAACKREVLEEIGLDLLIGPLLSLEYQPQNGDRTEALMFTFDGGVLSEKQIAAIQLPTDELSAVQFLSLDAALPLFAVRMHQRTRAALSALAKGTVVYLEDGRKTVD
jgi:8-oxo-dGTP diphosphatase